MQLHANAALGPAGRRRLISLMEAGHSLRAAAATAHRWWHRWQAADPAARRSGACLADRSSRPHRSPRRLSAADEAPILAARAQTNLGPRASPTSVGAPPPRSGRSFAATAAPGADAGRGPVRATTSGARPGALIHVDNARLARFGQAGHRTRGRAGSTSTPTRAWG
jgi:hypothetical protein